MSNDARQLGPYDRPPTEDETAGMRWWNSLTEGERGYWLEIAGSAVAADAYAAFKRARDQAPAGEP